MSPGSAKSETEIKLRLAGVAQGRRLLKTHGFRLARRRVFESNTLFDTAAGKLRRAGLALRLRKTGRRTLLTYKGPASSVVHKSREELELEVPGGAVFAAILERLGFTPVFQYDKYRTEYEKNGGLAMLDETPIGTYLELEGEPGWIDQEAADLGFGRGDYITASYAALYREWCKERPSSRPERMVFQGVEGLRAR